MYSTCLFCNEGLGANKVVESFPIGRRLAFDQRRGRLWVVCRKCEKWNLTPLEERWEAIETCERMFRDTRKRVSTDNIGLAKLSEGLELVRIGQPLRPEFVAWRYGDQFGRRRRRQNLLLTGFGILSAGGVVANLALSGVGAMALSSLQLASIVRDTYANRRIIAKIPDGAGGQFVLRGADVIHTKLVPGSSTDEWALQLRRGVDGIRGKVLLTGAEARRMAARVIPHVNKSGSTLKQTELAVKHLEEAGDPQRLLSWAARGMNWRNASEVWLAIEMAVNEENERHALESELVQLDAAWKEAEEIAEISDRLLLPRGVEQALDRLRKEQKR